MAPRITSGWDFHFGRAGSVPLYTEALRVQPYLFVAHSSGSRDRQPGPHRARTDRNDPFHGIPPTALHACALSSPDVLRGARCASARRDRQGQSVAPLAAPAQILTTFVRGGTIRQTATRRSPFCEARGAGCGPARTSFLDFTSTWQRWNYDAAGNSSAKRSSVWSSTSTAGWRRSPARPGHKTSIVPELLPSPGTELFGRRG